jgi:aspartokinase-like uncharacterized kinase
VWVVKIGGSLGLDPLLPRWLDELAEIGGGRVVIVPGGGAFAEQVRAAQQRWSFDDVTAHDMAVFGMMQCALMLRGLCPKLALARTEAEIAGVLRRGRVPVWLPYVWLIDAAAPEPARQRAAAAAVDPRDANWGLTSDSMAAWLANRLNAERLILVKACDVPPDNDVERWAADGIVDAQFGRHTRAGVYPVQLVNRLDVDALRTALLVKPLTS